MTFAWLVFLVLAGVLSRAWAGDEAERVVVHDITELPAQAVTLYAYNVQRSLRKRDIRYAYFQTRSGDLTGACLVDSFLKYNGEEFDLPRSGPCIKYRCRNGVVEQGTLQCSDGLTCYPLGYVRREKCLESVCTREGNTLLFKPRSEGCSVSNQCYPINTEFDVDCTRYRCTKSQVNNITNYRSERLSIRCKDAYGSCHNPGELFPYRIGSELRQHCACSVQGDSIQIQCLSL